ncbi:MAG: glycosyltransferase family 8 protein [Clostridiales bacterium]|nr:MAG: glycosyltransferase family 8 protein [Clostridiales bacterium]
MNIVYASDNNYAEILGVSLVSLFENNKDADKIDVYILEDHISEQSKQQLNSVFSKYGRTGIFIPIPDLSQKVGIEVDSQRWSMSTFSRLFLAELLPEGIEKALYLDCDTIVTDTLRPLWETDLDDYAIAGAEDCISKGHKKNIGLAEDDIYLQAGILLINLKYWRENGVQLKFMDFIVKYHGKTPYVDQGVINGVLSRKVLPFDIRYNAYTVLFDFSYPQLLKYRKPHNFYTKQQVETAKKSPAIVHFSASFLSLRPWIQGSTHPYTGEWLRFKDMSPWKDSPLWEDRRSGLKKTYEKFYKAMPQSFSVWLSGLLHSDLFPLIQRHSK